jgi:hypothetical protein
MSQMNRASQPREVLGALSIGSFLLIGGVLLMLTGVGFILTFCLMAEGSTMQQPLDWHQTALTFGIPCIALPVLLFLIWAIILILAIIKSRRR